MSEECPPEELLERVACRFKALADPNRLMLLLAMRRGERCVSELVECCHLGQANVSRHLGVLHAAGLVTRRREGSWAYYSLTDEAIGQLVEEELTAQA